MIRWKRRFARIPERENTERKFSEMDEKDAEIDVLLIRALDLMGDLRKTADDVREVLKQTQIVSAQIKKGGQDDGR